MKRFLLSLAVLIGALMLAIVLAPVGILYTLFYCIRRLSMLKALGYVGNAMLSVAKGIDLLGNVICRDLFNATFIKAEGHAFGSNYETISKVLGLNKRDSTLTDAGRMLANLLNFLQPGHVERAADLPF